MTQLVIYLIAGEILILLVLRPILLWYLKVNQALRLLQSIDRSLKLLPAVRVDANKRRMAG